MLDIAIVIVAGLAGGFLGGQVGSGALITLPALLFIGLEPSVAIATNILSAWLTNFSAGFEYWRHQKIDFAHVVPFSLLSFVGAIIGARLVVSIDEMLLSYIIAGLFILLLVVLFRQPHEPHGTDGGWRLALGYVLVFMLGIYGGFFTVGVTTFLLFLYTLLLKKSLLHAAADAVAVTSVMLVGALVVFVLKGTIVYTLALPLAAGAVVGALVGARTALRFGSSWLRPLAAVIVVLIVVQLIFGF